jgi:hypothetical protein
LLAAAQREAVATAPVGWCWLQTATGCAGHVDLDGIRQLGVRTDVDGCNDGRQAVASRILHAESTSQVPFTVRQPPSSDDAMPPKSVVKETATPSGTGLPLASRRKADTFVVSPVTPPSTL